MSKRIFSEEEIRHLLRNKNVVSCSQRSITYSFEFKRNAVHLYEQGITSIEIFKQAGLDIRLAGKHQPKECLRRWNRIVRIKGIQGLEETRGNNSKSRPRIKDVSDTDRIKRLTIDLDIFQ